ncbi:MAG: GDP-mannose 4,6-dehydratase [Leptospira sp.]|nr:GDP-mannose 4,6-dehydratase [Leptospira sp.]
MKSKIIVIGSNSFSGASFVDFCAESGFDVIAISRSEEYPNVFLPYKLNKRKNVTFVKADLNTDIDLIVKTIKDNKASLIVNFAAQGMVAESWQNPIHWFRTNTLSHIKLHDQLRNFDFIEKYVHISTPEVYGNCEGIVDETYPYNPSTPYATSKAACDMSLKTFYKNYSFPVCWTRAANVYGACQALYRIIPKTILSVKLGKKLPLHGGGHSIRAFIHIRDVCDATLKILCNSEPGEIYHLSTSRFISIRDLVRMITDSLGVVYEDAVEIVSDRPGKDSAYTLSSEKLRKTLLWEDKISLENGINETVRWISDNLDELKFLPDYYIHKE